MSAEQLHTLINVASAAAETVFRRKAVFEPVWHVVDGRDMHHVLPTPPGGKDVAAYVMRNFFELMHVKRYVLVDEAWMLVGGNSQADKAKREKAFAAGLAHHPDRVEVMWFSGEDHEAGYMSAHRLILRDRPRARLGPLVRAESPGEVEGRFAGMLPRKGATH